LLDLEENYTQVEGVVNMVSRNLNRIYKQLSLDIEEDSFTWYSARHTWASIAANECHYSDAEVARALNHQSEHKVTRGYIRPDWSLLDRMNEAVLGVVFNNEGAK
jgi:integrase